ncbi:MAG: serine hydrolase [Candidatus Omnitrophica bacterium]|nr:serine hydrolase [Candidatus Omnitrophota bacterium]
MPAIFFVSLFLTALFLPPAQPLFSDPSPIFPGEEWEAREPQAVGLNREKLDALRDFVGGRGCVIRHGCLAYSWGDQSVSRDVASAFKPVLSTLLCFAIQEGKITGPDECVARFEPRLKEINHGKDAAMTWRHLASQTACYGWAEDPGAAWAYNDYALALYYDTLMNKVFQMHADRALRHYLADPLQFQDASTFEAFGPKDRPGRLALSVRDFARFGYFILHKGRWRDKQLLQEKYVDMMLNSIVPPETPGVGGKEADMIPNQRSIGGSKNITPIGPGFYSFNWWLNGVDRHGNRLYIDAPPDAFVASGHGGLRAVWIIPSLDLIVSWNDAKIDDHDASPGNPDSKHNQALILMKKAVLK